MESIITTVKNHLANGFGNKESGAKFGGIATAIGATALGFLTGDWIGGAIGLVAGIALGPLANNLVSYATGKQGQLEKITAHPQKNALPEVTLNVGGKDFTFTLPDIDKLQRPWAAGESPDALVNKISDDTFKFVKNPEQKEITVEDLRKMVETRNQSYNDYMGTVLASHAAFEHYNDNIRPAMLKQLGISDEKSPSLPQYYDKLALKFSDPALAEKTRIAAGILEADWNKKTPLDQLSEIEYAMNNRMLALSKKYATLKAAMEEQGRKVPMDLDFSGVALSDRWNRFTWGIFGDTTETRIENAMKKYYQPGDVNEQQAEAEFRREMEAIANERIATQVVGGEIAVQQFRDMTALIIEEHRVQQAWNGVQMTKKTWAAQAERWLQGAAKFRKETIDATAKYAGNAGANQDFTLLGEQAVPIIGTAPVLGTNNVQERTKEIEKAKALARAGVVKANKAIKPLLATLHSVTTITSLDALPAIDIDKEIKTLPTSDEINIPNGSAGSDAPKPGTELRDALENAAIEYNAKLAELKANKGNPEKIIAVEIALKRLSEETISYLENMDIIAKASNTMRDELLAKLGQESTAGTKLEGIQGFHLTVLDKRGGKEQKLAFEGFIKDGKYTVTGGARFTPDGTIGQPHWFGNGIADSEHGIAFDKKTMTGIDKIIQSIDATPPIKAKPDSVALAPISGNILEQALKSIIFKPLADKAGSFIPTMVNKQLTA